MTRNFRKPNHTKASGNPRSKACAYCRRKFPMEEYVETYHVRRRNMTNDLHGPRYRSHTRQFARCRLCRSFPFGLEQTLKTYPQMRTPINMAYYGLPFPI